MAKTSWVGMLILIALQGLLCAAPYGGGVGTSDDPYQIWTPEQMNTIGANSSDWGKHFKLMADINMYAYTGTQYKIIGNSTTKFTGIFEGNGHIISNLTYTTSEAVPYVGLFGYNSNATIENLGVENINLTGHDHVGGLVGENDWGTLSGCYATGSVTGTNYYVGGLVGDNRFGTLTSCYSTGSVRGTGSSVGGLVGDNYRGTLTACYATGSVSGNSHVGGLLGGNDHWGTLTACFWDIQTSGQPGSSGGKGLTTEQMKTISVYQNAGWAEKGWVMNDGANYPHLIWENTGGVPIPLPQAIPLVGSGTADNPYLISTAQDFAVLSWYSGVLDKQIRLTADLDLSGFILYPIGDLGLFTGVFDGKGYIIGNAIINQPTSDYVGLLGRVGTGGQIRNLGVENVNLTGRAYVGGLVGDNDGTLTSCYATGSISGNSSVGGLVGINGGMLTACYAAGSISGIDFSVGGLAGYNWSNFSGTLTSCYATGSVSGNSSIGGLLGYNDSGTLTACYATGSATGTDRYVGGLLGVNYRGMLTSCYATGSVSGNSSIGGLVGYADYGTVIACFWDIQTSGRTTSAGGTGKTTVQMQTLATFNDTGWDFVGESANGLHDYWQIEVNDYPRLTLHLWTLGGEGTLANPYVVANAADLGKVWLRPSACYRLGGDLDLTGISWSSAIVPVFTGIFDGQRFAISHLTINQPDMDRVGLFGWVVTGPIRNLGVEHVNLNGRSSIGGLVGYNDSDNLAACYATGSVSGTGDYVGGLVGWNSGTLSACYSTGSVSGNSRVGGLVGHNYYCSITTCYATGSVSGNSSVGGLVGYNLNGTLNRCFWDMQTSGQMSSAGGIGKTTAEMQTLSTFISAGWDFTNEIQNGTNDTWRMCVNGVDYPRLVWEFSQGGDFNCPIGVGMEDLTYLAGRWLGTTPDTFGAADANFDDKVDLSDFAILAAHWLEGI